MYVNTYILGVPEDKKAEYVRIAERCAEVAKDHGAIEVFENWELDVPDGEQTDYRRAIDAKPGEKIVLSWIVWPDRKTGAIAHKKMFEDPRMAELGDMPFDSKRMILGGFEPIVTYRES